MSYMNQAACAPAGGIQDLSIEERALVFGAVDWLGVVKGAAAVVAGVAQLIEAASK